ncbi:hypothetical protein B4Q13_20070, partial [Lacticaseibacillus rhamnosus]
LYKRPLDTLLATWGLSLAMQQFFRSFINPKEVSAELPEWLLGAFNPTPSIQVPRNGIFVMGLTILVTAGVYTLMLKSRWGVRIRATTQNRIMSSAVGWLYSADQVAPAWKVTFAPTSLPSTLAWTTASSASR